MEKNKNNKPKRKQKQREIKLGHFSEELSRALNIGGQKNDDKQRNRQAKQRANT